MTSDELPVAVVTGANRGIGREVVRVLAEAGYRVVLGSRSLERGEEAAAALGGAGAGAGAGIVACALDVADDASVAAAAAWVADTHGRCDALVNNAAIDYDTDARATTADLDRVHTTLETNLFGAWRLTEEALPLMRKNGYGRIVNISSGMGQLSDMGGHSPAYRLSKTGLNVLTRMLTAELGEENILVNSVCPGWVRTDMGTQSARVSVQEGADTPVWLATLPDDGPRGGFFRNREPIPW